MPPAARINDLHLCTAHKEPAPIVTGAATVKIGGQPAARVGDTCACPPPAAVKRGSDNVKIENAKAARLGDETDPQGQILTGFPTVFIGSTAEVEALLSAAKTGVPFLDCKTCRMARTAGRDKA